MASVIRTGYSGAAAVLLVEKERKKGEFHNQIQDLQYEVAELEEFLKGKASFLPEKERLNYINKIETVAKEITQHIVRMQIVTYSLAPFQEYVLSAKERLQYTAEQFFKNNQGYEGNKKRVFKKFKQLERVAPKEKSPLFNYQLVTASPHNVLNMVEKRLKKQGHAEQQEPLQVPVVLPRQQLHKIEHVEEFREAFSASYDPKKPNAIGRAIIETLSRVGVCAAAGYANIGVLVKSAFDMAFPEGKQFLERHAEESCRFDPKDFYGADIERCQTSLEALGLYHSAEYVEKGMEIVSQFLTTEITRITEDAGLTQENVVAVYKKTVKIIETYRGTLVG